MSKYLHPIAKERLSELESNISRLQSEIATCTEGKEAKQVMKDEIKYWKGEIKTLKRTPSKAMFR